MTVVTEIYEVTGPTGAPVSTAVDNINFKNSKLLTTNYWAAPLRRPASKNDDFTYSFYKTFYFTLNSSTYVKNLKIELADVDYNGVSFTGGVANAVGSQLFFKFTNIYEEPASATGLHSMTCLANRSKQILYPFTSSSSPNAATSHQVLLNPNTTYYTNYLQLQVRVPWAEMSDTVGCNGPSYSVKFTFDSF